MRRKRQPQDSLELFLDAICNMFGGFLFLMLFVVVSMRATREATTDEETEGPTVSVVQYEELEIELEKLRGEWNELGVRLGEAQDLTERLVDKDVAEVYNKTLETLKDLQQVDAENAETAQEIAEIDKAYAEESEKRAKLQDAIEEAKEAEEEALAQAKEAKRANARSSAPPQLKESYKSEVIVALKYGKLYFWHKYPPGRESRQLNDDDFLVVRNESFAAVTAPKPWRGVDLNAEDVETRLDAAFRLAETNPFRDRIAILISDDSYEEFSTLRDYLKRNQYEIDPVVAPKGTMMVDRGGSGGRGQ